MKVADVKMEEIYTEAAEWLERLSGGRPDVITSRRFENWLSADARHAAVMERMLQTWSDSGLEDAMRHVGLPPVGKTTQLKRWGGAVAAAACLVVTVLLWPRGIEVPVAHFETSVAELRQFELEDGSRLEVAAASALDVRMEKSRRRIRLLRGAAYFDVAGDKARPFEVRIGGTSVVALGTEFNIEKFSDGVDITVHEGSVRVRADIEGDGQSEPRVLHAGDRVRIDRRGISPVKTVNLPELVDWRSGWLEVRDESLSYMLERFARHSAAPIELVDSQLGELRVGGRFRLADTQANLALLGRLYGLEVERADGRILVRRSAK